MPQLNPYEVLGIANPILDYILLIDEPFLKMVPGKKGGMVPVSFETFTRILRLCESEPTIIAGGSGSNTIKGLANLGKKCAIAGMIGHDTAGKKYIQSMSSLSIIPQFSTSASPTGQVACLITPDGERTCRSFLGATVEMTPQLLSREQFQNVKLVHVEGYSLLNKGLAEKAMTYAKEAGALVSLDLGSYEVVQLHKKQLMDLLPHYVDFIFGNENEARALTGHAPEKACRMLKDVCETAIVFQGKEGCFVGHGNHVFHHSANPVLALDSTGAGDLFASGFLYGILQNASLEECTRYGTLLGGEVVKNLGAEIPPEKWISLKQDLIKNL